MHGYKRSYALKYSTHVTVYTSYAHAVYVLKLQNVMHEKQVSVNVELSTVTIMDTEKGDKNDF